jgi:hypothetical protein
VAEFAADAEGHDAGVVDAALADADAGVGVAAAGGQRLGQGGVDVAGVARRDRRFGGIAGKPRERAGIRLGRLLDVPTQRRPRIKMALPGCPVRPPRRITEPPRDGTLGLGTLKNECFR